MIFHYSSTESIYSLVSLINSILVEPFSLGFPLLIHDAFFIVRLTSILGVSNERHSWRDKLLYNDLLEEYGHFYYSTSIFFHGYFSLHLPFSQEFSITVQSESYSK